MSVDLDRLRIEVRAWIQEWWDPAITVGDWWNRLAVAGWSHPTWPSGLGGRGLSGREEQVVVEELGEAGTIGAPSGGVGARLAAPTLLEHGTTAQVERYLPRLAQGQDSWCQLFSEPNSGSDLASLGAKAVRTGEGWVVTGQKVWSSSADTAQRGLLMARTNVDAPKHEGITYFVLDMDQDGVEVRPLKQINGASTFSEVFLDEVIVTPDDVVGRVDGGWVVAQTTLAFERRGVATRPVSGLVSLPSGPTAGYLDRTVGDVLNDRPDGQEITGYAIPWKVMRSLAGERGLAADGVMRQELTRYYIATRLSRMTRQRFMAERRSGPADGSVIKLMVSGLCMQSRDLVFRVLGAEGGLWGDDGAMGGQVHRAALGSFGSRIGGGTDEIQRNLIGERGLGLAREAQADKGVPYRDLRVGTQTATPHPA